MTFWAYFVAGPVVAGSLAWLAGVSLRRFSPVSLVLLIYLALGHVGLLALYYQWDPYSVSLGIVDRQLISQLAQLSTLALIGLSLGLLYVAIITGQSVQFAAASQPAPATATEVRAVALLWLFCLGVFVWYVSQVTTIAVLSAIAGDAGAVAQARSDMGNSFVGKYWRYRLFFRVGLDYCAVFFLSHWLAGRSTRRAAMVALVIGSAIITAVAAAEKMPLAFLLTMLYLTYVVHQGGDYWQRMTKYAVTLGVLVVATLYIVIMGAPDVTTAVEQLVVRVFIGQISPAYYYVDLFPGQIDYLVGRSLPNPGGLLPFDPFPLTQYVEQYIARRMPTDIVGSAPTVFWGELYANFGPLGVGAGALACGAGLAVLTLWLRRLQPSPAAVAAMVTLAGHYLTLTMTSLSTFFPLIDTTLLFVVATTSTLFRLRRRHEPHA